MYFSDQTVELQENRPEEFKTFILIGRQLEKYVQESLANPDNQELLQLNQAKYLETLTMTDEELRKNLTFCIYKSLKLSLLKKNLQWLQFFFDALNLDFSKPVFNNLLHLFLVQSGTKERNHMWRELYYPDTDLDLSILDYLLSTKFAHVFLTEQDEGYGNIPLHVACGIFSYNLVKKLILAGSDLSVKNKQGMTPEDIIDEESRAHKIHVESMEKTTTLERLFILKELFAELKKDQINHNEMQQNHVGGQQQVEEEEKKSY
eukprot:403362776